MTGCWRYSQLPWGPIFLAIWVASGLHYFWRHFSTAIVSYPVLLPAVRGSPCVGPTQRGMFLQVWRRSTGDGLGKSRNPGNRGDSDMGIVWGRPPFSTQFQIDATAKQSQAFGSVFKTGTPPKFSKLNGLEGFFRGARETWTWEDVLSAMSIHYCADVV